MSFYYYDNASTTQVSKEVIKSMIPYFDDKYGNPGSIHSLGIDAKKALTDSREIIAKSINANANNIIFTSSGSEANNMVFSGLVNYLQEHNKYRIIVSAVEHNSVLKTAEAMCIKHGFHLTVLPVEADGTVNPDTLKSEMGNDVGLVSIMHTNNELGSSNNIEKLCDISHKNRALFHTDCVQGYAAHNIDISDIDCDFASISGHKICAPKGIGAFYAKDIKCLSPLIFGGSSQEYGLRGGTENIPGIVGFAKASELISECESDTIKIIDYKRKLFDSIKRNVDCKVIDNGYSYYNLGRVLNVTFKGIDAETLLLFLSNNGIYASSGSACDFREVHPSHVLKAIGLSDKDCRCTIRFSFSRENINDDCDIVSNIINDCIDKIKSEVKNV